MATVIVNVASVQSPFPAGTVAAGISIAIQGLMAQTVGSPYSATFDNVSPGTYVATAQAVDTNGAPLGTMITSESFTVAQPDVMLDTPAAITITVQ